MLGSAKGTNKHTSAIHERFEQQTAERVSQQSESRWSVLAGGSAASDGRASARLRRGTHSRGAPASANVRLVRARVHVCVRARVCACVGVPVWVCVGVHAGACLHTWVPVACCLLRAVRMSMRVLSALMGVCARAPAQQTPNARKPSRQAGFAPRASPPARRRRRLHRGVPCNSTIAMDALWRPSRPPRAGAVRPRRRAICQSVGRAAMDARIARPVGCSALQGVGLKPHLPRDELRKLRRVATQPLRGETHAVRQRHAHRKSRAPNTPHTSTRAPGPRASVASMQRG